VKVIGESLEDSSEDRATILRLQKEEKKEGNKNEKRNRSANNMQQLSLL
jgi:hypothetical protein